MPSYLGHYKGAATNRKAKFHRAVDSFLEQSHPDKELIVVSDGCQITVKILTEHYGHHLGKLIKSYHIPKQPFLAGAVRQFGIVKSTGNIICYLDTDDHLGHHHLRDIQSGFNGFDWIYWADYHKDHELHDPVRRKAGLSRGSCGTSQIAHKKELEVSWVNCDGYDHDYSFVTQLKAKYKNCGLIDGTAYYVRHVPNSFDS